MTNKQQAVIWIAVIVAATIIGIAAGMIFMVSARAAERPDIIKGKIERYYDGDTFVLNGTRMRLWGVNSPEINTREGQLARLYLVGATRGKQVICLNTYRYTQGRTVAVCLVRVGESSVRKSGWQDIARMLVKNGHARDWKDFSDGWYAR